MCVVFLRIRDEHVERKRRINVVNDLIFCLDVTEHVLCVLKAFRENRHSRVSLILKKKKKIFCCFVSSFNSAFFFSPFTAFKSAIWSSSSWTSGTIITCCSRSAPLSTSCTRSLSLRWTSSRVCAHTPSTVVQFVHSGVKNINNNAIILHFQRKICRTLFVFVHISIDISHLCLKKMLVSVVASGATRRPWVLGKVMEKEYCQAKKVTFLLLFFRNSSILIDEV